MLNYQCLQICIRVVSRMHSKMVQFSNINFMCLDFTGVMDERSSKWQNRSSGSTEQMNWFKFDENYTGIMFLGYIDSTASSVEMNADKPNFVSCCELII